ncbi:unnamed protein product [Closterium sp. NIES-53]
MGLVLGGRRPVVLTGHADASWADDQATQRSSQGYTFSLGSGSVSWRSTRSSSVLSSSCEAEIYAGAMAAQELRWLTYLLTDLGEPPRSPPVLYVDNKAMLALCQEHRLEHRTKHIALRYFLARELQQRGQLRLAYVASEANTADIFTKALAPGDHQRFCTLLGFPTCTQHSVSSSIPCYSHINDLVFATTDTEALTLVKAELQERHTCTDLGPSALQLPVLLGTAHSSVYRPLALSSTFERVLHRAWGSCLEDGVQWYSQDTPTLLGPTTSCEAEIYVGAMAAQELRWLTYVLAELGERPRSPLVLYVDNKAMLALCHEQRLEHRTKHIALCYFLARELQQRRQLCLSYVASRANSADVFTKALGSGDHQRFRTALGLVPTLPHLLVA